ncbi:MAG TPA: polysaccharide biosynthesis/export family protein [Reyranellaceae bacterium]|nr:polysaccharide biosynthesis/export family protein [Reyranellaceae bacterium]
MVNVISRLLLVLGLALFAVAACSSGPRIPRNTPPVAEPARDSGVNYRLGVGDRVKVTVLGQPDLSGETEVDAGGKIVVALAGAIDAAGQTVNEVASQIQSRYAGNILRDPKVAVQVVEYRMLTVAGEVKSPGRYKFTFGMDVRAAIALAGGFDRRAEKDVVVVYRNNQAFEGRMDSRLEPGDTIEVQRR